MLMIFLVEILSTAVFRHENTAIYVVDAATTVNEGSHSSWISTIGLHIAIVTIINSV
jgi:hypothetical protein